MRDLNHYRGLLRIDKARLDDELTRQGEVLEQIGRAVSKAARAEAEAKRNLEQMEARLIAAAIADEPKLSQAKATTDAKLHRNYTQAHGELLDAREELGQWEALEKAWFGRGFDLRALGELWAKQYVTTERANGNEAEEFVRELRRGIRAASDSANRNETRARRRVLSEG